MSDYLMTNPTVVQASIYVQNLDAVRLFYIETMRSLEYRKLDESETTLRFGVTNNETQNDDCLLEVHSTGVQKQSDRDHVRFLVLEENILHCFLENGIRQNGTDPTGQGVCVVNSTFLVATLTDIEGNRLEVIYQRES